MTIDDYLNALNPEQLAAVKHEGSPLLILAGAGSGKTRVITTKIAYLIAEKDVRPSSILAVTFTKKAANEMQERAVKMEPRAIKAQIRTFHSFGTWFLRMHAEEAGLDPNFTVYDDDDMVTLLTKAVPSLTKQQAAHVAHKISLAKDYCLTPESPELSDIESAPEFPDYYSAYEERLRETGNVDFGDLIMKPVLLMQDNPAIRAYIHSRFKVIMVDEYQDSNVAQFKLLELLTGEDTYVCVVGDDDQSIYRFRGAEVQNILSFQDHFANTTLIKLERNYRSKAPILKAADSVVSHNTNRLGKTLISERGDGKAPVLTFLPTQDDETEFCAELISQAHKKGCPYSDWAILYRTNAQSLGFETEFLHRKIPYTVVGSLKFYEREEIKDTLALLAFIVNPRDEIAFRRIVNKPPRGIGGVTQDKIVLKARENAADSENLIEKKGLLEACRDLLPSVSKKARTELQKFVDMIQQFMDRLGEKNVQQENAEEALEGKTENDCGQLSELISDLIKQSGLSEFHAAQDEIAGTQKVANLEELCNSAVPFKGNRAGLLEFLDHIELDRTLDLETEEDDQDRVTLITLHNTKGLEFPRVIITGLEAGIFPRRDKEADELEDERRLFYVGITRAKDELYMTSCQVRRMYGRTDFMECSPFLLEVNLQDIEIIGKKPSQITRALKKFNKVEEFPNRIDSHYLNTNMASEEDFDDETALKWKKGRKIYHDDYGYGQIIKGSYSDEGEYVIIVQFENGASKRFLPAYQSHSLMLIGD